MERVVKGIVMDIAKDSAVIMTNDGEFLKVKKPSPSIALGDEITSTSCFEKQKSHLSRYAGLAAAILLLLIPFLYFREAYATVAYVNVDINPSLEIGINRYNRVNDITALNSDGAELIKDMPLKGLEVKDALNKIIITAKDSGYINDGKVNNIEVALIALNPQNVKISEDNLINYVKDAVETTNVDATIKVQGANREIHDNAKKENISTNKYLDKTQGGNNSIKVDVKKSDSQQNKDNKSQDNKNGKSDNDKNSKPGEDKKVTPQEDKKDKVEKGNNDKKGLETDKTSSQSGNKDGGQEDGSKSGHQGQDKDNGKGKD